jgi:hypothetical protein
MSCFDTVLKELILGSRSLLVEDLAGSPVVEWVNVEFPRTRNARADLVGWLADGRLWHLELQGENDDNIDWRALEYLVLIHRQMKKTPIQVTLYVGDEPLRMRGRIDLEPLRFRHRVVDIRDFDAERLLASENLNDNVMSILCRVADRREAVRRILRRIAVRPGPERADALARLLVLSGLRGASASALVAEESRTMPVVIDPMKNPVLRQWYEEALAQGFARGQEQGANQESDTILRHLLERRFGPLPEWTASRLASSTREQREDWALRLLDASSLEDIFRTG